LKTMSFFSGQCLLMIKSSIIHAIDQKKTSR
jgi:hypothetical protein